MQSDKFDKKARDAAEHHHPAYDEQAWEKMEKLLDKHLPQKEDNRKRFIFFLLLFLVLGSGTWLMIARPWKPGTGVAGTIQPADSKSVPGAATTGISPKQEDNHASIPGTENREDKANVKGVTGDENRQPVSTSLPARNGSKDAAAIVTKRNNSSSPILTRAAKKNNQILPGDVNKSNTVSQPVGISGADQKTPGLPNDRISQADQGAYVKDISATKNTPSANKDKQAADKPGDPNAGNTVQQETVKKESGDVVQTPAQKKAQSKNRKSNSLFFTISAGPDISMVGADKPGKTKLLAGLGVGYTFKDRVTVRTGFFTARKIYSAAPSDYNAPPEFYTRYPYLEKVDADCKVYEIPLLVSYHFGRSAKQNWFAAAGLSSYLMKRETYTYFYKYYPNTPTTTAKWTLRDKNNHFFSVLNLSAGYQRNINKTISVTVEPYMKLPLSGVGYGKVKLNSGGVIFSLGIKPFQGKK